MALGILSRTGQSGKVLIGDSREDGNGATMLFVCEEFPGVSPGALYPLADDEPPKKRGKFPVLLPHSTYADASKIAAPLKPFELKIDTTKMPGAMLPFVTEKFIAKVIETANEGVVHARIDASNASEWGYDPTLISKAVSSELLLDADAYPGEASGSGPG